jgi:tRNA nucleotidyltransferase (CCA-adding enzyme)
MQKYIDYIKKVETILQAPVYLVGGAVRDILLGKTPKDLDFCTALLPDEIEQRLEQAGRRSYSIGKKFGTIGFKLEVEPNKFEYIEITTFRGESYIDGNRKPIVSFITDLQEDLSRRDFTINSMAIDSNGKTVDYFGGQADLENQSLRAVGNPKIRFREDPVRILRAIRFGGKYNLAIEEKTWEYVCKMKYELLKVSKERWVMELDKILSLDNPTICLDLLMNSGILGVIIPELSLQKDYQQNSPWHDFDLWTHTQKVICNVPKDNLDLRWTALLHDIAKPFTRTENPKGHSNYLNHDLLGAEMSIKVSDYLKFSKSRKDYIYSNILDHLKPDSNLKKYDDAGKKIAF